MSLTPVVNGNPEFSQGRIGQAINFTSPGQYVDLGNSNDLQFGENTDFSVAFWFKSDGINSDPSIISNKNWNSGSNTGWILAVNSSNLIWNFKTSDSSRLDYHMPDVVDHNWHHIVVTHDRDGNANFYKDGNLIHTVDISGMKGTLDSPYTTKIGQDGTGRYGSTLTAKVDELQIHRRALTESEVQSMFRVRSSTSAYTCGINHIRSI